MASVAVVVAGACIASGISIRLVQAALGPITMPDGTDLDAEASAGAF